MEDNNTSISFCPRTEGDGMESMDVPITTDLKSACVMSTANAMQNLSLLPLKSPPPAERIISLIPKASSVGLKPKPSSAALENKKAKFVPYEPYKAAVKPIVPQKKKLHKKGNLQTSIEINHEKTKSVEVDRNSAVCQKDHERVVKEREELQKELIIQSKVNTELKRLLVASVGEDMEARVHFLTEDKVKLADDIRQYVEKIALDFEQKEKLSIEADIWRSKFLASSVVIDELTKWKAALCNRNANLQLCIQGLLDEAKSIQNHQQKTYNHLKALNRAFHPLGNSNPKSPELVAHDVIEASVSILKLVESLSKRLLGTYTQVRDDEGTPAPTSAVAKLSTAQLAAQELLTTHPVGSCTISELNNDMTAASYHVAALARRSMNKSFYTCCPHCTGEVHIV